ncbi:MAG: hypothetical protein NC299_14535 [Lachnospiraceae bacterium]|nr:hypothetical protein [Ruminococcus sp.]MCM1276553.1 hypothetical protein [Lachnospiraceae bacterium]
MIFYAALCALFFGFCKFLTGKLQIFFEKGQIGADLSLFLQLFAVRVQGFAVVLQLNADFCGFGVEIFGNIVILC